MVSLKRKRLRLSEKCKTVIELESEGNIEGSRSADVTSDNDEEESSKEPGPPKRPSWSEIFVHLKLLQNCCLFEEEQVTWHLRSFPDKFSTLYKKTLQSKKQHAKDRCISYHYKLMKRVTSFEYIKLSKKSFSSFSNHF